MSITGIHNKILSLAALLILLFVLQGCASTSTHPGFFAGERKNSLPFMDRRLVEAVHSIVIPAFYSDRDGWREISHELMTDSRRVSVISLEKIDSAMKDGMKDLALAGPEGRLDILVSMGRAARADAVLNGIILSSQAGSELILQLISTKDSRVLWWQAADFRFRESPIPAADQKVLLTSMMEPLILHLARRERPAVIQSLPKPQPKVEEQPKTDMQPGAETQPKADAPSKPLLKPKTDKRPERPKPQTGPVDISPM
ncbi:MAG: hypothetical protein HZA17_03555 [Nitrospirae bacterium]|nr:hypothetical protein [Nitrospirota bacterium]